MASASSAQPCGHEEPSYTSVCFYPIAPQATVHELSSFCMAKPSKVRICREKCSGVVDFGSEDKARAAMCLFDGSHFRGQRLHCRPLRKKSAAPAAGAPVWLRVEGVSKPLELQALREISEKHCEVVEAEIAGGAAFMRFQDQGAARRAADAMDGLKVAGADAPLRCAVCSRGEDVKKKKKKKKKKKARVDLRSMLLVEGIAVEGRYLKPVFEGWGSVAHVSVFEKAFAVVVFHDEGSALKAAEALPGCSVLEGGRPRLAGSVRNVVRLAGMPAGLCEDGVRALLQRYGRLRELEVEGSRVRAVFVTVMAAKRAVEGLDGVVEGLQCWLQGEVAPVSKGRFVLFAALEGGAAEPELLGDFARKAGAEEVRVLHNGASAFLVFGSAEAARQAAGRLREERSSKGRLLCGPCNLTGVGFQMPDRVGKESGKAAVAKPREGTKTAEEDAAIAIAARKGDREDVSTAPGLLGKAAIEVAATPPDEECAEPATEPATEPAPSEEMQHLQTDAEVEVLEAAPAAADDGSVITVVLETPISVLLAAVPPKISAEEIQLIFDHTGGVETVDLLTQGRQRSRRVRVVYRDDGPPSRRALQALDGARPWGRKFRYGENLLERGAAVQAFVQTVTTHGAFVTIGWAMRALIPVREIKRVASVSEHSKVVAWVSEVPTRRNNFHTTVTLVPPIQPETSRHRWAWMKLTPVEWLRALDSTKALMGYSKVLSGRFRTTGDILVCYTTKGPHGRAKLDTSRFLLDLGVESLAHARMFEQWFDGLLEQQDKPVDPQLAYQ